MRDKKEDYYNVISAIIKFIEEADNNLPERIGFNENSK